MYPPPFLPKRPSAVALLVVLSGSPLALGLVVRSGSPLGLIVWSGSSALGPGRATACRVHGRAAACRMTAALDEPVREAAREFLNTEAAAELALWVLRYSAVGEQVASKNFWSRGLWTVGAATVSRVDEEGLSLDVTVIERGRQAPLSLSTWLPFRDRCATADALRSELLRLNAGGGAGGEGGGLDGGAGRADTTTRADALRTSGTLLGLPGATNRFSLPEDMWLNTIPNSRSVRRMFYDDVASAILAAVADPAVPRRMSVVRP